MSNVPHILHLILELFLRLFVLAAVVPEQTRENQDKAQGSGYYGSPVSGSPWRTHLGLVVEHFSNHYLTRALDFVERISIIVNRGLGLCIVLSPRIELLLLDSNSNGNAFF